MPVLHETSWQKKVREGLEQRQKQEDHTLLLRAFIAGLVRWDKWDDRRGELCFGGICYATELDEDGVPKLYDRMRFELFKLLKK